MESGLQQRVPSALLVTMQDDVSAQESRCLGEEVCNRLIAVGTELLLERCRGHRSERVTHHLSCLSVGNAGRTECLLADHAHQRAPRQEHVVVRLLDAVADAAAMLTSLEFAALDPEAHGLLVRADVAGDVGNGQELLGIRNVVLHDDLLWLDVRAAARTYDLETLQRS